MAPEDYRDLLPASASDGERLGEIRLSTVNRVARLRLTSETGLAKVHALSNDCIELSSIMDLQIGQVIELDLSERVSATATVATKDRNRYSLTFEHRVNCAELLRQLVAEARSDRGSLCVWPLAGSAPGGEAPKVFTSLSSMTSRSGV